MKILVPLITQSSPSRTAVVSIRVMSLPWSGSVNAPQESTPPSATLGSHSAFCSSLPKCRTISEAKSARIRQAPTELSPRQSSSATRIVLHDPHPLARILLRKMDADESEVGGFFPDGRRVGMRLFQLLDDVLFEFAFDKIPDRFLDFLLRFAQFKLHTFVSLSPHWFRCRISCLRGPFPTVSRYHTPRAIARRFARCRPASGRRRGFAERASAKGVDCSARLT